MHRKFQQSGFKNYLGLLGGNRTRCNKTNRTNKEIIMFTCIECEHHYDHTNGDVDERMCHECLDEEDNG